MPAAPPWGRGTASAWLATSSTLTASVGMEVGILDVNSDP